jgi:hypothetical protein
MFLFCLFCLFSGAALLPVANCMNHSCDPNVISSSSHNNHTASFVALRPIEAGEELCISYVNDELSWEEVSTAKQTTKGLVHLFFTETPTVGTVLQIRVQVYSMLCMF